VGDDANPCSRTAPPKTFAGAISKVTVMDGGQNCTTPMVMVGAGERRRS
jgi:hypothetical protein